MADSAPRRPTVADHVRGKPPAVVRLFERVLAAAAACGPLEVQPQREVVVLRGRRRIFAALRLTDRGLRGHLNLPRRVGDARFTAVAPLTKRLFLHRFALTSAADVDDAFLG